MTMLRRPSHAVTTWSIAVAVAIWAAGLPSVSAAEGTPVVLFSADRPLVYLDLTDEQSRALNIADPVTDFVRCFEAMTGDELPRTGGRPRLFDPTRRSTTRFECRVVSMRDTSKFGGPNAQVGIVLSPVRHFKRSPFAEAGEKVGWTCTWDKPGRKLTFQLTVANQAYYGPGYGPFTFVQLEAEAPDFEARGSLRLALESRNTKDGCLRGSYSINNREWIATDWFDPTKAGTDESEPGRSDKNGTQAWGADWPQRWRAATALYLTAYHPKGREASVVLDDARVTRDGQLLFASHFSREGEGRIADWACCPDNGTVRYYDDTVVLKPARGGWCTVGLRAQEMGQLNRAELTPIRVILLDYPANVSKYDAPTIEGFEINALDDCIELRAHTSLGLGNALYHLLHHWGCRWIMPGELGECIPKRTKLTFPEGATHFSPRADTSVDTSPFGAWYKRNLGGWQHWLSGQHYWFYAIPPEKRFADHPQWYSLLGGKRVAKQLCSTNPEVVSEMIRVAKAYLRRNPRAASFPMDPNDNIDFCQCKECTALDVPGAMTKGAPSVTDRVLTFVNAVADGIRDELPDRYVAFCAYSTHIAPPIRVRPADNVVVIVCRSSHCLLHLTPTEGCPTSDFHAFVSRWRALTPNIYTYEYDPISWTGGLPCPIYMEMARSLKHLFNKVGVKGSYSDGAQYAAHASTYINRYIARRMKVDPSQEPDEVLRDMCRHFFGPAAGQMELYYLELAKVTGVKHAGRSRVGGGTTFYHEIFRPEIVQAARRFLDRAIELCRGKGQYEQRVEMVDMSQRYLEAYLEGVWRAQEHRYEEAVAAFDRMDNLIDEMEGPGYLHAADARRRAKTMRMKALAEHFPQRLGFVTKWKLLGPFDNTDRNADVVRDSFEPIRSLDDPIMTDDGKQLRWWNYESPSGLLNLEKAFEDAPRNWTLSYAYAGATLSMPHDVIAQLRMDSFFPFRVFVNGKEVFYRAGLNADCPGRQLVDVKLKEGENTFVIKLSQTQVTSDVFPWGLYFRVVVEGKDAAVLPDRWAFKPDPQNIGQRQKWYSAGLNDSDWQQIPVPSPWERTVGAYDGYAWYRVRVTTPANLKGQELVLAFRGVDEEAWVYLNGEYIGERTEKSTGKRIGEIWDQPFEIAVPPEHVRWGEANLLAVRVHDSKFAGGIFRAVRLLIRE